MNPAEIAGLVAGAHRMGWPQYAPIFRACYNDRLTLVVVSRLEYDWLPATSSIVVSRRDPRPLGRLHRLSEPVLAIVGDDDCIACGPNGWPVVARLIRWARAAFIHGGATATTEDYQAAVALAERHRRLVFVESDRARFVEWVGAFAPRRMPLKVIQPDKASPVPPEGRQPQ